jgi:light-regulated signal transduction histidine kinase (bacteriophytochrome)
MCQRGYITLYVKDNGSGVRPENRQKVFDMFQRLHRYETHPGNGISVAICKRIVKAHGEKFGSNLRLALTELYYFNLPITMTES